VAKRPKYQLIASVLYLLDFWLRKVARRTELFLGEAAATELMDAEEEYDKLLDAIVKGIKENYGDDEMNLVLDLVQLRRGHVATFEALLREKTERRQKSRSLKHQVEEAIKRKRRARIGAYRREWTKKEWLELIAQEAKDAREETTMGQKELKQFLEKRKVNRGLTADEND